MPAAEVASFGKMELDEKIEGVLYRHILIIAKKRQLYNRAVSITFSVTAGYGI